MNNRITLSATVLILLASLISFRAGAEDFTNAIHAYLQQCVHAEIPNGCIVVGIVDQQGSRVVSCGTLDNGTDEEANGDTVFAINSMTGTFTQMVLQTMVDRGLMKLDDPAANYLPRSVRMPARNGKQITLRHLLYETSGLPDFHDSLDPKDAENPLADFTLEKMDAFVSGSQLTCDPGTKHFHGAVDKGLLGQAIELKAGTNFESLLVERICGPLKMDSTRFTLTPELKSRLASAHNPNGYAMPALQPLAGLFSTVNDLLKFVSALDLTNSALASLETNWAVFSSALPGTKTVYTGGGLFGSRSLVCYDKAHHRGIVVLSTSTDLRSDFGDFLLAGQWRSERRPSAIKISSQVCDGYVGEYRPAAEAGSRVSGGRNATNTQSNVGIRREGDRLFVQVMGPGSSSTPEWLPPVTAELLPESETSFFERLGGRPVVFSRDASGKVTGLRTSYQGKPFSYEKISAIPPKAPEPVKPRVAIKLDTKLLDAVVGDYEFPAEGRLAAGTEVTIWREGEQMLGRVWSKNALRGAFSVFPESETNFFLRIDGAQLIFVKNAEGQVTSLIHRSAHAGVPDNEGKKLPDR